MHASGGRAARAYGRAERRWTGALRWCVLAGVFGCGGAEREPAEAPSPVGAEPIVAPDATGSGTHAEPVAASQDGLDRVGQLAPAWGEMEWIGSEPLMLADLRGRVVLIRFWTDTCPFCRATAPALAEIDADFRARGVTVIGLYHPKPRGASRTASEVAAVVEAFGWRFPVGLDAHWDALDAFWLDSAPRRATSASFVLDRRGVIRYVHPGPEYHPGGPPDHEDCRRAYADVRAALEALLAEPYEGEAAASDETAGEAAAGLR
jgi:thiol-disulfide isomerase/thioredoxin